MGRMSIIGACGLLACVSWAARAAAQPATPTIGPATRAMSRPASQARDYKVVHVFVALCDNKNQGIVPVPAAIGNGQDAKGNLYWGAKYGVKTFFGRSAAWSAVEAKAPPEANIILDRIAFKSRVTPATYLIADAYDGAYMDAAIAAFLSVAAGRAPAKIDVLAGGEKMSVLAGSGADLVCFVGHNGLMDTPGTDPPQQAALARPAGAVVLACKSEQYFSPLLRQAGCAPLITTTSLMSPEAYTLEAIVTAWAAGKPRSEIRAAAARAYASYQKCSLKAATGLFSNAE